MVWYDVICDHHLTEPYVILQRQTGDIYGNYFQHELPPLILFYRVSEKVPPRTRLQMFYQYDRASPHFSCVVRHYLNRQFP
jgi:hypothetical protein